jgi:dipeptidyl aminopeptidase/acylaminoacyl peptidase
MKKRNVRAEDFLELKFLRDIVFSPCGRKFIFTVKRVDKKKNKYFTNLYIGTTKNSRITQFTHGDWNDTSPRWSPDGKWIAFLSNREEKPNIYLIPTTGGESRRLTNLEGIIAGLSWMADSKKLIYSFCAKKESSKEKNEKKTPLVREINRMYYKADGFGYRPECKFHIYTVNIPSGRTTQLTDGQWDEHFPTPSPDGRKIAFISNRQKEFEYNMLLFDIWVMNANGKRVRRIPTPKGLKQTLSWSPDGKSLAYVGNDKYKDYTGALNRNLWIVSVDKGRAKNLTKGFDRTVMNVCVDDVGESFGSVKPSWTEDNKEIIFGISNEGSHQLFSIETKSREITNITPEEIQIFDYSYDRKTENIVYTYSHPTSPSNIALINRKSGNHLYRYDLNSRFLRRVYISNPERFSYKGAKGDPIHGWIMKPPHFRKGRRYPLIVEIHGGPHAQYPCSYFHEFQMLAGSGYVVFYSNPHGSQGYGERFAKELTEKWGRPDYIDIMNGVEILSRKRFIDRKRMGVTGGSYGGFMTNWIVGHTETFKAAVTQRCVSNLISMTGTSDGGFMMSREFGGPWWKNREKYWGMSPLKFVRRIKTPLLIIHSENDMRTPIEQAEQLYIALKLQKKEVRFVRYPEESHGLSRGGRPDRRIDRLKKILSWFDTYLKKKK